MNEMVGFMDMVQKNLENSGADKETIELWKSIVQWYEEGGPDVVEEGIKEKIKEVKKIARKQYKEIKEVMPSQKKKKKTRR
ncbi:MAG: hypothetical protein QXH42_10185 [Thermoplasmata archaeon]